MPPAGIVRPVAYIADRIAHSNRLRSLASNRLPVELAEMYDYINFAHPFREGNGRTQREFFDQLASESGRGLAWDRIDKAELHDACHVARAHQQLAPLEGLFARILDDDPAYLFD